MKLVLDKDFTIWEEYRVIVLTIEDIYWQNIVSGVDSEAFFIAKEILPKPPSLPSIEEPTLPSGQDIEPINSTLGDGSNIWGVTLNSWTITSKIDKVAEGSSKLPTAWSEHILLLILALLLASGFVIYTYKKA
jgi:hypothetical protein